MSILVKHLYRFGPFDLDAEQRLVRRENIRIALQPKAFDLLLYMVRNPLRLLTKDELLQAIWPDSFVEESNLTQNVFLLRKALTAGKSDDSRYIVTVTGRGYQFVAPVEMVRQSPQNDEHTGIESEPFLSTVRSRMHIVVHEEIDDVISQPTAKNPESTQPSLVSPSRDHHRLRNAVVGLLTLGLIAASLFWWKAHHRQSMSQNIVLADFVNQTSDDAFDLVLRKALEIDLGQSPYFDVMSEQEATGALQLMGRKRDAALTPDVATEICQRSNRQVMVKGSIANLGREYVLTLQAFDCYSGKQLAETKAEASGKEKVLRALDAAVDQLRHGLGESGKSVEQFFVPIAQATTSSLDALKAYSIGEYMVGRTGKDETETLPMFQRAVELDPNFAMAYAAIAKDYYNLSENNLAKPYYQKAFDLSGQVSEKEKLYIRAHYFADNREDIEQGIKAYQLWAETYPRDWGPWLNIANSYTLLGQYDQAIAAGKQALALDASRGINYSVLARAYLHANRYANAKSTALRAVAMGRDSYALHATLFQIAYIEHDQAAMSHEAAGNQGKPSAWFSLDVQAFAAATSGKYKEAEELFHAAYDIATREKLTETADDILIDQATMEFELGAPSAARLTLKRVQPQDADSPDLIFLLAELGDFPPAKRSLAAHDSTSTRGTLMNYVYLPRLRAELDLQRSKPLDALASLEIAAPYEFAGGFTLISQRGEAYLRSSQREKATLEFRKILAHQGLDPISPLFPLAHLWLGRIDAESGNVLASRSEYEALFAMWKDGNQDLPVLLAAKREYAALH